MVIKGRTDGVSEKLKNVADGTDKVKKAADAAGASQEKWGDKLDAIDKKMSGFAGGISKITGVLGAAGLVGAVMGAVGALGEMADRANQITVANLALRISIGAAREATMGLVDDMTLTLAANKATQLGVVKTDAEFAKLSKTAARLGMAMGQDAAQSVDDLTTALGRQSFEILDNLGIVLKVSEANEEYAARLGKTADKLTDAERKQAFMVIGLERAEAAAEKANVSLDTHATRVQVVSTCWTNFKDDVAVGVTAALANMLSPTQAVTGELERLQKAMGGSATTGEALERGLLRITDRTNGAKSALMEWAAQTTLAEDAMGRLATVAIGERNLDLARGAYLARKQETEEARKTMALEIRRRSLQEKQLEQDARKRGGGKGTAAQHVASDSETGGRGATGVMGIEATNQITDSVQIEAANEAMARELILRQDRIALAEREHEIAAAQVDAGLLDAEFAEELQHRKYRAEADLLDFQMQAANSRAEIIDLETARRRKATQEQQRIILAGQAAEIKALAVKRQKYEQYGGAVGDVLGQVTVAAIENAKGQEGATARALASIATGIRNQMILTALKEFALAAASAASFNYPGAIQHATAGGLASAAAVAAGIAGAAATAAIPSAPSLSAGGSESGGSGGSSGRSTKGGAGDEDGVPTSYYDGGLYSKRPEKMPQVQRGTAVVNINATVLGGTRDEVGQQLSRIIRDSQRSLGKVG